MGYPKNVVVFTVAGSDYGMGHLLRISSLAVKLVNEWNCNLRLVISGDEHAYNFAKILDKRLDIEFVDISFADSPVFPANVIADFRPIDIIIIDTPPSAIERVRTAKEYTKCVVLIDDFGCAAKEADISINMLYYPTVDKRSKVKVFNSHKYIILRDEFKNCGYQVPGKRVKNILILSGGADGWGISIFALKALKDIGREISISVVKGHAYRHGKELDRCIKGYNKPINVYENVNNMSEIMYKADLAISAGGVSCFELCCLGIPVIGITGEKKEDETLKRLHRNKCIIYAGMIQKINTDSFVNKISSMINDFKMRKFISNNAKKKIDTNGSERIRDLLYKFWLKRNNGT